MSKPTQKELDAAQHAYELRQAKQFAGAVDFLEYCRAKKDSSFLRGQTALSMGAGVEYRIEIAESFGIRPPDDVVQRILRELDQALALDDTVAYLHWDRAVIHSRYTGDLDQAHDALARAESTGIDHPMLEALKTRLAEAAPPLPLDQSPDARLRTLFFQLVDKTAAATIPESRETPQAQPGEPVFFADYVALAESTVHEAQPSREVDLRGLYARWSSMVESGVITADPLDYGSELMFRAAAAGDDKSLAVETLHDLASYLRDFSFHVSGGTEPSVGDLRKGGRIARRALDIIDGAGLPFDADLHADLWLALGQSAARPSDMRLADALDGYTRALVLKRESGNTDDIERLTALLRQMLDYATQRALGTSTIGVGDLGKVRADMEAAYAASKIIGDREETLNIGEQYQTLLSSLAQPLPAIDVLDELLLEFNPTTDQRTFLQLEKAMRLSEAREPARALALQDAIMAQASTRSERTQCLFWNAYSNVLRQLERYQQALEAVNKAHALCPEHAEGTVDLLKPMLHTNRGLILLLLGRAEEAEWDANKARAFAAKTPSGDAPTRIGELRTLLALHKGDYALAIDEADKAFQHLQQRLTTGGVDFNIWQSMLQEWSRFDSLGLEARVKSDAAPEATLAFAEAAKGRFLRFTRGPAADSDPGTALSPEALTSSVERAIDWSKRASGRIVLTLFCSSRGIAIFSITSSGRVRVSWVDGPVYDRFRDACYTPWDDLSVWALDRSLQSAAVNLGAPAALVLRSAEAMSALLLDKIGAMLHDAVPELANGGTALVIVPHRTLRSLPLVHAALPDGRHLSELFDQVTTVPTLDSFIRLLDASYDPSSQLEAYTDPVGDLPFARLEGALGIAERSLTGWQVTRRELMRGFEAPGRLLISTHGDFNEIDPFRSWLAIYDGRLYLHELLEEVKVGKSLVVLSSCELGRSLHSSSDEPFGFPAMLHDAGVAQVIAPCWRVDDLATFLLMTYLQDRLAAADPPSVALNRASHWLRTLNAADTLARIDDLKQRAYARLGDESTQLALDDLEEQCQWLQTAFTGPEQPFRAPLFWAGFQLSGAPVEISRSSD